MLLCGHMNRRRFIWHSSSDLVQQRHHLLHRRPILLTRIRTLPCDVQEPLRLVHLLPLPSDAHPPIQYLRGLAGAYLLPRPIHHVNFLLPDFRLHRPAWPVTCYYLNYQHAETVHICLRCCTHTGPYLRRHVPISQNITRTCYFFLISRTNLTFNIHVLYHRSCQHK